MYQNKKNHRCYQTLLIALTHLCFHNIFIRLQASLGQHAGKTNVQSHPNASNFPPVIFPFNNKVSPVVSVISDEYR